MERTATKPGLTITTDISSGKVAMSTFTVGPMIATMESHHMASSSYRGRKAVRLDNTFAISLWLGELMSMSRNVVIRHEGADDRHDDLAAALGLTDTTINDHLAAHVAACLDRAALCTI